LLQSRTFNATRSEGLRRLQAFLPLAGRVYADQRNHDRGADHRDAVSTLSPYIRHRLISEQEVLRAVIDQQGAPAAEKFITEVFWRTYWKGYLEMRPTIWDRVQARVKQQTEGLERGGIGKAYRAATEGQTGIDAFDHWAQELVETGYLHNHARMWFASIWIFTLRLPWELGADFFMRHLIDGDPASNTLSWRWVAGLHTKGKNYLAQRDNINRFTDGRFFPKGLIKAAVPLDETASDALRPLQLQQPLPSRPFFLLLCDEDLGIETLGVDPLLVKRLAIMDCSSLRSPNQVAEHVHAFAASAAADALLRASGVFPECDSTGQIFNASDHEQLVDLVASSGMNDVAIPHVPAGPVVMVFERLADEFKARGFTVHRLLRRYDAISWPHASRGFFQMREKIPTLLADLGLASASADVFGPRERQRIVMHQR
jgi:deoxyribodipyrimidine photo-lyase